MAEAAEAGRDACVPPGSAPGASHSRESPPSPRTHAPRHAPHPTPTHVRSVPPSRMQLHGACSEEGAASAWLSRRGAWTDHAMLHGGAHPTSHDALRMGPIHTSWQHCTHCMQSGSEGWSLHRDMNRRLVLQRSCPSGGLVAGLTHRRYMEQAGERYAAAAVEDVQNPASAAWLHSNSLQASCARLRET